MNNDKENEDAIPTVAEVQVTQIKYCQMHYDELIMALVQRNLQNFIATTSDELADTLEAGRMDVALEASSAITNGAMSLLGYEAILAQDGCPVCAIQNIIAHVADHVAVKYLRSN